MGVNPPGAVLDREASLIRLLKSWKGQASHVFILGDLFEFWYEYRYYVDKEHFALLRTLADLVDSGVEVHLLRGNHDFAYGTFFPENLGVQVHDCLEQVIQGKKVLVAHGDGVARSDYRYRLYRKFLDLPLNRWIFRQIHPDWGMALARFVGRNSRKAGESRTTPLKEYLEWGEKVLVEKRGQICIHGHHHIPGIWEVKSGLVASPGGWIKKLTYLKLEAGELFVKEFGNPS